MKTYWRLFGVGMALLWLVAGCATVEEEVSPADISLAELEIRMRKAMDPQGRFAGARTFFQDQVVSTDTGWLEPPREQRVEVRFQQPSSFKLTTFNENEPVSALIFNASRGWSVNYKRRRITELGQAQLEQLRLLSTLTKPDSRLQDIFSEIRIFNCRIDDEDYYRLSCRRPGGMLMYIYVNRRDFLTWRIKGDFKVGDVRVRYDSSVLSYSLYEGVMIPVETRVVQNGEVSTTKVISYKLNTPMSPREFQPPIF